MLLAHQYLSNWHHQVPSKIKTVDFFCLVFIAKIVWPLNLAMSRLYAKATTVLFHVIDPIVDQKFQYHFSKILYFVYVGLSFFIICYMWPGSFVLTSKIFRIPEDFVFTTYEYSIIGLPCSLREIELFSSRPFFNSVGSLVWIHLNCSYAIIFFG